MLLKYIKGSDHMAKYDLKVSLDPKQAYDLIIEGQSRAGSDLVHEEFIDLGDGRYIGTLVFEKYYFRAKNRAALVVIIDNIKGYTDVRSISTGSSEGLVFNFDWGAADDFAYSVIKILDPYTIE